MIMRQQFSVRAGGFTLLEVLVALVIVGTALGASLRAVSSLTQNSAALRASMMATWSAENHLTQIRLDRQWLDTGRREFACPQGELQLHCAEVVLGTINPYLRRVEISVYDGAESKQRLVKLVQVIINGK